METQWVPKPCKMLSFCWDLKFVFVAKWVGSRDPTNREVVGGQWERASLAPPDSFWLLMTPPWLLLHLLPSLASQKHADLGVARLGLQRLVILQGCGF